MKLSVRKSLFCLSLAEHSDMTSSNRRTKWWRTLSASTSQTGCGPVAASATSMAAMSVNSVVIANIITQVYLSGPSPAAQEHQRMVLVRIR